MSELMTVPARQGRAAIVKKGQMIKIVNTHGQQVVDTWAFSLADLSEFLSMEHMRQVLNKVIPAAGDVLASNRRRPILTFMEDTSPGVHDTLMAACDIYRYINLGITEYHENCTDNMYAAMAKLNLFPRECPSPLNLWMNTPAVDNEVKWLPPVSKPGDYVVLRAEMDCAVCMSSCPQDMVPINGENLEPSEAHYMVYDG